jgi:hypothetical protein
MSRKVAFERNALPGDFDLIHQKGGMELERSHAAGRQSLQAAVDSQEQRGRSGGSNPVELLGPPDGDNGRTEPGLAVANRQAADGQSVGSQDPSNAASASGPAEGPGCKSSSPPGNRHLPPSMRTPALVPPGSLKARARAWL